MKEITILSYDQHPLFLAIYEVSSPVGVVQVMHGMEEHKGRYDELAKELNKANLIVITSDMRGHGKNCPKEELGYFGHNGKDNLINDQKAITDYIQKTYPNLPIYIYAHSMGTIVCRNLLQTYDDKYQKVILSGAPYHQKAAHFGVPLASLICKIKGEKTKGRFLKKMTTGGFNKKINSPKTKLDWLSYNQDNVQSYFDDPLCGFSFTNGGYRDLIKLLSNMDKKGKYQRKNPSLKISFFIGVDDPVTGGENNYKKSCKFFSSLGYNVSLQEFQNMRHELTNEKDKDQVFKKAIEFYLDK